MPLEVFHYHKAIVHTNYKLWHDTNSEFYHDYLHYFNRVTGMMQPGYFDRKYTGYPNGHASVGSMTIKYDAYEGSKERGVGWPGLAPGGWILIDIFPAMTYNLRTSVLRMDTSIPLGPEQAADRVSRPGIEERHAGAARRAHPRPQHDLGTVRPQPARGPARRARPGSRDASGQRSQLGAPWPRGEHDDPRRRRHAALLRRMEQAHGARGATIRTANGSVSGRLSGSPRDRHELQGTMETLRRHAPTRIAIEELVYRSCLALDEKNFKAYLDLCDEDFRYTITAYSPEIRKDMIWLDHDKPGMQLLFGNLPRHNSDHSPLTRHATVYTVEYARRSRRNVVSALQVFRTALDGGATELFAVGRYLDTVKVDGAAPKLAKRVVKLETRQFGFGYHIPF